MTARPPLLVDRTCAAQNPDVSGLFWYNEGDEMGPERCANSLRRGTQEVPQVQPYSTCIKRVCPICQSEYWVEPSRVRKGQGKFCSSACFGVSRRGISNHPPPRPLVPHPDDSTALLVPLTKGYHAVIDCDDADLVESRYWQAAERGNTVYAVDDRRYLHRVIMGVGDDIEVDHEDWDGLNCRRSNLRIATRIQNAAHTRNRIGKSGYRGVWPTDSNGWQAMVNRKCVGVFDDAEQAARAYDAAAREQFGEFAVLNFPADAPVVPSMWRTRDCRACGTPFQQLRTSRKLLCRDCGRYRARDRHKAV